MPATPAAKALLVTPSTPSETALVPVFTPSMAPLGAPVVPTIANPAGLEAVRVTVDMFPALKLPAASRFTMAFEVLVLVGATFHLSPSVPLFVTGEPLTVKSLAGAVSPTLFTVPGPVPGNVCPAGNVICPLLPSFSPVSAGVFDPAAYSRFKVPAVRLVLFPTGSACQRKFCGTAAPTALLYTEAVNVSGCEFFPAVAVAAPVAGKLKFPRTVPPPFTSSVLAGFVVLIPTFAVEPLPL
jgi:hypothetical protein